MNFKEALIAHLQGEKVEASYKGAQEWVPFVKWHGSILMDKIDDPDFAAAVAYRLAPRTIFVNGVEVPAPESVAPKEGCFVYVAEPTSNLHHFCIKWGYVCEQYIEYLKRGLVYFNKEDAIARAKAMLLTSDKEDS